MLNLKLSKGVKIAQQITVNGRGGVLLGENTQLGVYPSLGFNRGEFYLEARQTSAVICIETSVFISNNCVMIADKS